MKISEFLKQERQKRYLTQEQMAKKLGVNRTTYATYENGWVDNTGRKSIPGARVALKIAKFTRCSKTFINELIENERKEK